jgi:hypothetical protein
MCGSDSSLGLRHGVPALLIRLGEDQRAYDFVKWYATTRLPKVDFVFNFDQLRDGVREN